MHIDISYTNQVNIHTLNSQDAADVAGFGFHIFWSPYPGTKSFSDRRISLFGAWSKLPLDELLFKFVFGRNKLCNSEIILVAVVMDCLNL